MARAAVVLAFLVMTATTAAVPQAIAAPAPPAEPPSPVSGPVTHPGDDGGHASHGRGRTGPKDVGIGLPHGMDVSGYQGEVDWDAARADDAQFAYVKATEGTTFQNANYKPQYDGAAGAGILHGAYHFALPDRDPAADQAAYFVAHGGSWTADGKTLPPMLDIEDNPYGDQCYGLSTTDMTAWVKAFSDTVHAKTGRFPTIYTSTRWWKECTGDAAGFGANPLFVAHYEDDPGPMPASWTTQTFWQFSDEGKLPGDQDVYAGTQAQLESLAKGEVTPDKRTLRERRPPKEAAPGSRSRLTVDRRSGP